MKLILSLCLAFAALTSCSDGHKEVDATGVFEATEVVLSAQTPGELIRMSLDEGDTVRAGEQIASVDTVTLALQREALLAKLHVLSPKHYNIANQVAALKQQIATARSERQRFAGLVKQHAANRKQVDDLDAQIALLDRQLAAQSETMAKANQSLTAEGKTIEAQVAQIDDQLRRTRILSPIDGSILAKYAEAGELATVGKPLYKVADLRRIFLRIYVTAPQVTRLRLGQQVTVLADEGQEGSRPYKGRITWISDQAEFTPKTIQTRDERANLVYAVKVAVPNDGRIKLGMYGSCIF